MNDGRTNIMTSGGGQNINPDEQPGLQMGNFVTPNVEAQQPVMDTGFVAPVDNIPPVGSMPPMPAPGVDLTQPYYIGTQIETPSGLKLQKKSPNKWLIIAIIAVVLSLGLAIASAIITNRPRNEGAIDETTLELQQAFNIYANYLLYGDDSEDTPSEDTLVSDTETAIAIALASDEPDNRAYLATLDELFQSFKDAYDTGIENADFDESDAIQEQIMLYETVHEIYSAKDSAELIENINSTSPVAEYLVIANSYNSYRTQFAEIVSVHGCEYHEFVLDSCLDSLELAGDELTILQRLSEARSQMLWFEEMYTNYLIESCWRVVALFEDGGLEYVDTQE